MYSVMHWRMQLVLLHIYAFWTCWFWTKSQFFVLLGKGKLTPNRSNTIPRMELCSAILGVEVVDIIKEQLFFLIRVIPILHGQSDRLGSLTNTTHRFYVYVSNRVNRIHSSSSPRQWTHVPTKQNPANLATRAVSASQLSNSIWLTGPPHKILTKTLSEPILCFPLIEPRIDREIRPEVTWDKVQIDYMKPVNHKIGSERFLRFSTWESFVRGVKNLKQFIYKRLKYSDIDSSKAYEQTELNVIQTSQGEAYGDASQVQLNTKILDILLLIKWQTS